MNAGSPSADRGAFPRPVGLPKGLGGGRGGTRWRRGGHGARHLQAVRGRAGRWRVSRPSRFGSGLSREGPGGLGLAPHEPGFPGHWGQVMLAASGPQWWREWGAVGGRVPTPLPLPLCGSTPSTGLLRAAVCGAGAGFGDRRESAWPLWRAGSEGRFRGQSSGVATRGRPQAAVGSEG